MAKERQDAKLESSVKVMAKFKGVTNDDLHHDSSYTIYIKPQTGGAFDVDVVRKGNLRRMRFKNFFDLLDVWQEFIPLR